MLRWWFVDGVSKSSTGVDASSATSSVADGELSVDAMRIAPIYNNQSVPGYEECAGGSGHDVVWERERGRQRGARGGSQHSWGEGGGQDEWRRSCSGREQHMNQSILVGGCIPWSRGNPQ